MSAVMSAGDCVSATVSSSGSDCLSRVWLQIKDKDVVVENFKNNPTTIKISCSVPASTFKCLTWQLCFYPGTIWRHQTPVHQSWAASNPVEREGEGHMFIQRRPEVRLQPPTGQWHLHPLCDIMVGRVSGEVREKQVLRSCRFAAGGPLSTWRDDQHLNHKHDVKTELPVLVLQQDPRFWIPGSQPGIGLCICLSVLWLVGESDQCSRRRLVHSQVSEWNFLFLRREGVVVERAIHRP